MDAEPDAGPREILARLEAAMNEHDLGALLACMHPEYRSEQPVHPERGFGGRDQVEKNWAAMFSGIPDFRAELLETAVEGDTAWTEWRWTGTRADGSPVDVRGVTVFRVEDGLIVSGRFYMEEVEQAGADIDETVSRLSGRRTDA